MSAPVVAICMCILWSEVQLWAVSRGRGMEILLSVEEDWKRGLVAMLCKFEMGKTYCRRRRFKSSKLHC
ncbi:unnamed protein product [Lathyrus oleraceus]